MVTPMAVKVRALRPGDGSGIARAWLHAAAYYADLDPDQFRVPSAEGLARDFEGRAGRAGEDVLELAADLDGRAVGWLSARIEKPSPHAAAQLTREHGWTRLVVDALIVDPEVWRRGAGTALLEAAESWGRDRGAVVARLDTYAESPVSVPFYEDRMGYRRRSIIYQKWL